MCGPVSRIPVFTKRRLNPSYPYRHADHECQPRIVDYPQKRMVRAAQASPVKTFPSLPPLLIRAAQAPRLQSQFPTPHFYSCRVCVLLSLSFLELEISEAQRAHAHSAPARTAAPGTPLSRKPLSRRVCVCYIFFLELKISDFRTGDGSINS